MARNDRTYTKYVLLITRKSYQLLTKNASLSILSEVLINIYVLSVAKYMKPSIHPQYYTDVKVSCSCGNSFTTGSTVEKIDTEICSNCHPFYTGKQKILDTTGNVDRFKKRVEAGTKAVAEKKEKAPRKTRGTAKTVTITE